MCPLYVLCSLVAAWNLRRGRKRQERKGEREGGREKGREREREEGEGRW